TASSQCLRLITRGGTKNNGPGEAYAGKLSRGGAPQQVVLGDGTASRWVLLSRMFGRLSNEITPLFAPCLLLPMMAAGRSVWSGVPRPTLAWACRRTRPRKRGTWHTKHAYCQHRIEAIRSLPRVLVPDHAETLAALALLAGQHVEVAVGVEIEQFDAVELDPRRATDVVRLPRRTRQLPRRPHPDQSRPAAARPL